MDNNVIDKIVEVVKKNLEHLTWRCSYCPKILECEEQPGTTVDYESRYCWTIIEAAIRNEKEFAQPF